MQLKLFLCERKNGVGNLHLEINKYRKLERKIDGRTAYMPTGSQIKLSAEP